MSLVRSLTGPSAPFGITSWFIDDSAEMSYEPKAKSQQLKAPPKLSTTILSFSTTCPRQNPLRKPVLADLNPVNAFLFMHKGEFLRSVIQSIDKIF
jgi:hypothetical protein